jgi:hypothetical protein
MLKYVSKFTLDILPSLLATVIGAYIVNHYIVAKPDAPAVAAVSTTEPKAEAKASGAPSDLASAPEPGVRAKGISEKSIIDKSSAVEKAAVEKPAVEKAAVEKPAEKSAEKPAETASLPAEPRRHQPVPRERTAARTTAPPVQPSAPAVVPVVAAPPAEAATAGEDHRDANDLARAAIERLRGVTDNAPRAQEAARAPAPDAPRVAPAAPAEASRAASTPAVRPLPPPIMVSTPAAGEQVKQPYADGARTDDARRPTPPADIPLSQPLDLRAEAADPSTREHKNVAEDMLSAAKSVFHAVLPK